MAGILSRPTTPGGTIEDMRFGVTASAGALTEPGATHRTTGWALGEKPSYKEFNYTGQKLWRWMARLRGVGLFLEAHTFQVEIMATGAIGYVRTLTIAGVPVSYTTQAGDTTAIIATRWAAQMNADATFSGEYDIYLSGASTIYFVCRTPAKTPVMFIVDVNAVLTTLIAAPYKVRLADDDLTYKADIDLVFGSSSTEDTGSAGDDARFLFDKSKAAARFGRAQGAQWDDASRGDASMAWGEDCTASGDFSTAGGSSCLASGDNSTAIGASNIASGASSVAIGTGNTASAIGACAIGSGCTASATASTAIGQGATAGKQNAVAIGMGNAQGLGSVAIGGQGFSTADAMDDDDVAIGTGALANNNAGARAALAIGAGASATAGGSVAIGCQNSVSAADATAAGTSNVLTATQAQALGVANVVAAAQGSAVGTDNNLSAAAVDASAVGRSNTLTGGTSAVLGDRNTASGLRAKIVGTQCTAAGPSSYAGGYQSETEAAATYGRADGYKARASNPGEKAYAGTQFGGADKGETQCGTVHVKAVTTDDVTATDLTAGGTYAWTPLDDGAYMVKVSACAKKVGAATMAAWEFQLPLLKSGGAITFPVATTSIAQTMYNGGVQQRMDTVALQNVTGIATVTLVFAQNAGSFRLIANGLLGETWRWAARIEYIRAGD